MQRVPLSMSAMRARVSSTASTNASSANHRCGTSKHADSPALQRLATDNRAELHFVLMVGSETIPARTLTASAKNMVPPAITSSRATGGNPTAHAHLQEV